MPDLLTELTDAVVVDFESDPTQPRPDYPPEPVGVAIKVGAAPAAYLAWRHPVGTGNNCTREDGINALHQVWACGRPLLFHHSKFDLAVAHERLGLPLPAWDRVHDSLPLLFLLDPRAETYSLKPSSECLLNWPPEERDAVIDWLIANQPVPDVTLTRGSKSKHYAGAYVGRAPVSIVAPYACGDVDRTRALALWAATRVIDQDMVAPYRREMQLQPTLMDMERRGLRVDQGRLTTDLATAAATFTAVDAWLFWRLGRQLNLDSGDELAQALVNCGAATAASLGVTKTGKLQTNKDAFKAGVGDKQLSAVLRYRAALKTTTGTFMRSWLATAQANRGRIFTTWNSTRTDRNEGYGDAGARTGRFSSSPPLQNIPKKVKPIFACVEQPDLPPVPFDLPPLPRVRSYVLPEEGHVLIGRDFASQELRVMAHCEDGAVAAAYRREPELDLHRFVAETLTQRGFPTDRDRAKTLHFAVIYGVGIGHLAEMLSCAVNEARAVLNTYYQMFPSVRELNHDTKERWRLGFPVRTWGGRVYQPEAPRLVDGRLRRWDYKALNVVVQGGSADLTKAAMIEYAAVAGPAPMILTVHDEIVVTAPADEDEQAAAMARLRDAMNVDRLDVPMRSEGYVGPNWQDKTKLKDVTPPPPEPDRPDDGRYEHGDGKLGPQPPFPK